MSSSRAEIVAEVLWELKRADKVATFSRIADRAGFSAGSNGRTMATCIERVKKDWPHLQWWRAIKDDGLVDQTQGEQLQENGYTVEEADGDLLLVKELDEHLMEWEEQEEEAAGG